MRGLGDELLEAELRRHGAKSMQLRYIQQAMHDDLAADGWMPGAVVTANGLATLTGASAPAAAHSLNASVTESAADDDGHASFDGVDASAAAAGGPRAQALSSRKSSLINDLVSGHVHSSQLTTLVAAKINNRLFAVYGNRRLYALREYSKIVKQFGYTPAAELLAGVLRGAFCSRYPATNCMPSQRKM